MTEIKINPELQKLIPPLSVDEFETLKRLIIQEGCRDPLIVWQGTIIDGHNRYRICTENNIVFKTVEMSFDNIDNVKVWMIDNQKGRRNLTDGWKYELSKVKKAILLEKGRAKKVETLKKGNAPVLPVTGKTGKSHNTQTEIAEDLNWSKSKVAQADKVWKAAETDKKSAELVKKVKDGDITINNAYAKIRKEEKKIALKEKKVRAAAQIKAKPDAPKIWCASYKDWLPDQPDCDLLLTDPPYSTDVEDISKFAGEWLPVALEKLKSTGRAYVFIGAYPEEIQAYLNVKIPTQILVWTYRNTLGPSPKKDYKLNWQAILYYRMPDAPNLDCEIMLEQFTVQDIAAPDGRIGNRYHSWQKPEDIAERFIRHSTTKGQIVLDPFCCTGTFPIVAGKLGRVGLGCDINIENLKIAEGRGCELM